MRTIGLIVMLCVSIPLFGKSKPYSSKAEQEVLRKAFEIIQVFYPSNSVCVSDSIYDQDMDFSSGGADVETQKEMADYRVAKKYRWDSPYPCKNIFRVLGPEACNWEGKRYVVEFSAPDRIAEIEYNHLSQPVRVKFFDGKEQCSVYDNAGQLIKRYSRSGGGRADRIDQVGGCPVNNLQDNFGMPAPGWTIPIPLPTLNPIKAHSINSIVKYFEDRR